MSELIYALAGVACLTLGVGYALVGVFSLAAARAPEMACWVNRFIGFFAPSALVVTAVLCFWLGRHLLALAWCR